MARRKPYGDYKEYLIQTLEDPEEMEAYINAALEEDDVPEVFLLALRDVVETKNFSSLAKKAGLNRVTLYRMLSKDGNPRLENLAAILNVLGLKLRVERNKAG